MGGRGGGGEGLANIKQTRVNKVVALQYNGIFITNNGVFRDANQSEALKIENVEIHFRLAARVLLYAPSNKQLTHTTAFGTPVVEHWLQREMAQRVHNEGSIRRPIAP